jgi:hypothetical protein
MTLTELLTVIAIGSIILGLMTTVTTSLAKHDSMNLARQTHTDAIRQTSIWLTDALTYAASDPTNPSGTVFEEATPTKMVFYSALTTNNPDNNGQVSKITITAGQTCWTNNPDPGVLHRCVQQPQTSPTGTTTFCTYNTPQCPNNLFEDLPTATNIQPGNLFSYSLGSTYGIDEPVNQVETTADLTRIAAIDLNITTGTPNTTQATINKRITIKGWSKL